MTCGVPKTVDHYFLSCSRFIKARAKARAILKTEKFNTITSRTLLHNKLAFKATETFVELSARLPQFRKTDDPEGTH
jgi:hypothetical protein